MLQYALGRVGCAALALFGASLIVFSIPASMPLFCDWEGLFGELEGRRNSVAINCDNSKLSQFRTYSGYRPYGHYGPIRRAEYQNRLQSAAQPQSRTEGDR